MERGDAKVVHIGNGSGTLSQTSMDNLEEGDTIVIAKGTYSGGTFTNLKNVTIVPEAPGVTFTGAITINHNEKVTFDGLYPVASDDDDALKANSSTKRKPVYGYTFSGFNGYAFHPLGNNTDLTIKGLLCANIACVIDGGPKKILTYTGTDDTTLYKNLTVDYLKCTGRTVVYDGTWEPSTTYNNVNIGMKLKHVIIANDGTGNAVKVFGFSIYQMVAEDWIAVGPSKTMQGDCGFFTIEAGNVILRNIYRNGGWGNLLRIWNCSLREPSDTYMINCIDMNTSNYTTFDCSIDTHKLNLTGEIPIVGNNGHALYVTSGDKKDMTTWATTLLIVGNMFDGSHQYTAEIKNCFAFSAAKTPSSGTSSLIKHMLADSKFEGLVQANNIDVFGPLPDGYLLDKTYLNPAPNGPLIGKAEVIPDITTDIYGTPRGDKPDIGAVQHFEGGKPPLEVNYDLSPEGEKISRVLDQRPAVILNAPDAHTPAPEAASPYLKPVEGSQIIRYIANEGGYSLFKPVNNNGFFDMDPHAGKVVQALFKIPADATGGPYTAENVYKKYDAQMKADGWTIIYSGTNQLSQAILDPNRVFGQQILVSLSALQNCYYIYAEKHADDGDVHQAVTIFDFSQDDWFFKKGEVGMSVDSILSKP